MGIIKKSSSRKQIQFITDDGTVYFTSRLFLAQFLNNDSSTLLPLKRYATGVPEGKFKKSEIYDPNQKYTQKAVEIREEGGTFDALKEGSKDSKEERTYSDAKVW
jgi:hypothetical protein